MTTHGKYSLQNNPSIHIHRGIEETKPESGRRQYKIFACWTGEFKSLKTALSNLIPSVLKIRLIGEVVSTEVEDKVAGDDFNLGWKVLVSPCQPLQNFPNDLVTVNLSRIRDFAIQMIPGCRAKKGSSNTVVYWNKVRVGNELRASWCNMVLKTQFEKFGSSLSREQNDLATDLESLEVWHRDDVFEKPHPVDAHASEKVFPINLQVTNASE